MTYFIHTYPIFLNYREEVMAEMLSVASLHDVN